MRPWATSPRLADLTWRRRNPGSVRSASLCSRQSSLKASAAEVPVDGRAELTRGPVLELMSKSLRKARCQ